MFHLDDHLKAVSCCHFEDPICCDTDFASLDNPQGVPLLCYCKQSWETEEDLEVSDQLLGMAVNAGLSNQTVTIDLTSCEPLIQLCLSTAFLDDCTNNAFGDYGSAAAKPCKYLRSWLLFSSK